MTLLTRVGYGQILPGSDPGIAYDPNPYLLPDNDGDGLVKIIAASDGKTQDANVLIETRWMIFIPTVHRGFVFVNGTATPRPTRAVPTPTPFF